MTDSHRSRLRVEPGAKRVRAYLAGHLVADTTRPVLVWEGPHYPTYYLPVADVRTELLTANDRTRRSPSRGEGRLHDLSVPGRTVPDAALRYPDSPVPELRDLVRLDWNAMDQWFEEDEEVFVHPRDPYTRVDVLASSRHVRVEVDGVLVAESRAPRIVFETGLPPRYYLPQTDVSLHLLEPSDTVTHCPYKGTARYVSARLDGRTVEDIAWSYPTPLPESQKIAGLLSFYDSKAEVFVDGELQGR
ncbi:hypothetical protein AQ490_14480 [Wenjunlia vitaminophila]|uniref:DUF427 domain-containing protein n=1 Tax=Wenjunlia vitaminophila TaxID=76728 RepID=A0A0T6LW67_WENVI|nr:DUF427 domain-containing protein [Wenjunlia vitaminophila]KRV50310.1 hypothetical protein AQ490_14480 [Wenjunlia vitaminophila]